MFIIDKYSSIHLVGRYWKKKRYTIASFSMQFSEERHEIVHKKPFSDISLKCLPASQTVCAIAYDKIIWMDLPTMELQHCVGSFGAWWCFSCGCVQVQLPERQLYWTVSFVGKWAGWWQMQTCMWRRPLAPSLSYNQVTSLREQQDALSLICVFPAADVVVNPDATRSQTQLPAY